jgi:hypothetical protein
MANPGPASTVANHPQNLGTNQALRLLASYQSVNLAATGDTVLPILNTGSYSVANVIVTNASANLSTSTVPLAGLFTASGGNGTAIVSNASLSALTSASVVSQRTVASTAAQTGQNLYFNVGTAASYAATVDVFVYGYDLTFLP